MTIKKQFLNYHLQVCENFYDRDCVALITDGITNQTKSYCLHVDLNDVFCDFYFGGNYPWLVLSNSEYNILFVNLVTNETYEYELDFPNECKQWERIYPSPDGKILAVLGHYELFFYDVSDLKTGCKLINLKTLLPDEIYPCVETYPEGYEESRFKWLDENMFEYINYAIYYPIFNKYADDHDLTDEEYDYLKPSIEELMECSSGRSSEKYYQNAMFYKNYQYHIIFNDDKKPSITGLWKSNNFKPRTRPIRGCLSGGDSDCQDSDVENNFLPL